MSEEKQEPKDQPKAQHSGAERASKMMDSMFKGLKEFGHAAKEKAEEYGKIASDKAEELTKLGKIKLDIHQLNRSRTKTLTELGELVFELNQADNLKGLAKNEKFLALLESIEALDVQIAEKEALEKAVENESQKAARNAEKDED